MYKCTNNACTHLYTIGGFCTCTNVQIMHVRICIRSEDFVHVQFVQKLCTYFFLPRVKCVGRYRSS